MDTQHFEQGLSERASNGDDRSPMLSRREFLFISGGAVVAFSVMNGYSATPSPHIIMERATGLVMADPAKCVGCRRCELACTEFNDGNAHPGLSRIKIARNLNFGPAGLYSGGPVLGVWGNGLIVQDVCKQCPHPVPCANACPTDAIIMRPPTNARWVDPAKCDGCKMCLRACPWEMMSFDEDSKKAVKCFLCDGNPKCVEACPSGALSYVAWHDLTRETRPRVAPTAVISPEKAHACNECHKN